MRTCCPPPPKRLDPLNPWPLVRDGLCSGRGRCLPRAHRTPAALGSKALPWSSREEAGGREKVLWPRLEPNSNQRGDGNERWCGFGF